MFILLNSEVNCWQMQGTRRLQTRKGVFSSKKKRKTNLSKKDLEPKSKYC